ncbi:MAG TPA: fused MFS/spermidine synthase [Solirubrobacterales bacterium]|nr:fused MFS/spermidine synthase [Solirubrobacterales bacterium]
MARGKKSKRPVEAGEEVVGEADQQEGAEPGPERAPRLRLEATADLPTALPGPAAAALVFVAAGAVLMLEILAVRLLAPYVGLTLETTTSIIGAALAGIAAGAAIGGYLADRTDTKLLVVGLLVLGGLLTLLTVPIVHWLGPGARGSGDLAALGITALALVPAAAVLSAVSPAVAHLQLHDLHASGTIVGRLSAWATAGALLGTFGAGFVVIPLMPVGTAVLVIGLLLVLVGIGLGMTTRLLAPAGIGAALVLMLAFGAFAASADSPCLRETHYHCIELEVDPKNPDGYELVLDNVHNSYVDLDDPTYLRYEYTNWIADAVDGYFPGDKPLDAVFVGGGAFTLPRWLLATRPGSEAEVLEVDGEMVDFVEEQMGLRTSPALRATVGDARMTMRNVPSDSADLVVGDAFSGFTVPWHLTTTEWLDEVQRVLKPGGLYAANLIDLQPLDFIKWESATFLETFHDVKMITFVDPETGGLYGGNVVLLGSNRKMPARAASRADGGATFIKSAVEELAADGEPLRDDYAPVDQLRTE